MGWQDAPLVKADPLDYSDRYNTQLTPQQEQDFQAWVKPLGQRGSSYDYDMRGAFLAGAGQAANGHFPDTFKKPNHPTFSNGSKYSGADGNEGGEWAKQPDGSWTFAPSASILKLHQPQELQDYFSRVEPGNKLKMPAAEQPAWASAPVVKPAEPSLLMAPVGGAEMLGKAVTGTVASIPAALAYGGAAVGKAFGADVDPSKVQGDVQRYFTWQPRSDSGKAAEALVSDAVSKVAQPVAKKYQEATQAVAEKSPFAGELMKAAPGALQAASAIVPLAGTAQAVKAAGALNAETDALKAMRAPTPEEAAISKAQALNIKLLPSQQGRTAGAIAEGLSGQAKLERSLSKENAVAVDKAVAEEIGLPAGTRPTKAAIAAKKAEAGKVYGEVAGLGKITTDDEYRKAIASIGDRTGSKSFPEDTPLSIKRLKQVYGAKREFDGADSVAKVRQLRADATANLKAPNAPEQNALGYAQRRLADILDDQMQRAAEARGLTDLVTRYQSARVQLAKLHSVEDAIRGQNVSAKALSQQQKRGAPLSGKLKDVADTYDSFDRVLQEPAKIRDSGPLSVVDFLVGAGASLHNPLLATAALSRPLVRAGLASDLYQKAGTRTVRAAPISPAQLKQQALAQSLQAKGRP